MLMSFQNYKNKTHLKCVIVYTSLKIVENLYYNYVHKYFCFFTMLKIVFLLYINSNNNLYFINVNIMNILFSYVGSFEKLDIIIKTQYICVVKKCYFVRIFNGYIYSIIHIPIIIILFIIK